MHEQFGRYILLERIAIGGMAEIFRAKASGLGGFEKILAIKRLHPRYSQDADFIEMLIDEARISVELAHGNIGQIFDLGKVDDHYFIAMEYIDGRDLYRVMKRLKDRVHAFPIEAAAHVAMEAAAGLDYAHRKKDARGRPMNIIHRDVSPQNVLLSYEGEVKLVDFGIAKAALRAYETESGIIKGKFYYMSPEQARGEPLDHRTDIFSLGIVLYEMLTGDLLYKDDDEVTLLSRVRRAEIQPPTHLRPEIPAALERVVMRALSRDREDRYPSALHLHRDLQRFLRAQGADYGKAQIGRFMRDLFLDEGEPDPTEDGVFLRNRSDFMVDRQSVISFGDGRGFASEPDDSEDSTAIDSHGGPPSVVLDASALGSFGDSEALELGSGEILLVDEHESTDVPGPRPVAASFDSIEIGVAGAPVDFGEDEFEDETTKAFQGAVKRRIERASVGPADPTGDLRGPDPAAFAAAPTPVPARPSRFEVDAPVKGPPADVGRRGGRGGRSAAVPSRGASSRADSAVVPHEEDGFTRQPTVIVPSDQPQPPQAPPRQARPARARRPGDVETPTPANAIPIPSGARWPAWLTRERLILGGVLSAVIVVAAVVTSVLLDRGEGPTAPKDEEPAVITMGAPVPQSGVLSITSYPSGATVKVADRLFFETTPTKIDIPAPQTVKVRVTLEQYEPYESEVTLEPGENRSLHVRLEKIRGTIAVESIPSGASVFIDGTDVGLTPLTKSDVPADRPVRLRVAKDGFVAHEKTIDWNGRRELNVEVQLEPAEDDRATVARREPPPAPPRLEREPPPRRVVERDPAPPRRSREPPAIRELERPRASPPARAPARETGDRQSGLGYLSVNARRWGSVYVDGQLVSPETPLVKYKIPAGSHRVQVYFGGDAGQKSPVKTVKINRGENSVVLF